MRTALNGLIVATLGGLLIAGCTPQEDQSSIESGSSMDTSAPPDLFSSPEGDGAAVGELAPPVGASDDPNADPVGVFRMTGEEDEQGQLIKLSDLDALQRVVDAYSYGPDGLGAPPLKDLSDLIAKGYLRRIPDPPPGKRWGYDVKTWKVSLLDL